MKRPYKYFLQDALEYAESAEEFIENISFEEFESDKKTVFAVIRALEIVGEALNNIPDEIKDKYKSIPWYKIRGFRNTVIHEYFGIDKRIVWDTVKLNIPFLKKIVNLMLADIEES